MQWSSGQIIDSLASLEGDWNGFPLRGIQELSFSDELKREPIYANGSVAIGLPAGMYSAEGELTTIVEEFDGLGLNLGGANVGAIPGTIGVTLFEPFGSGPITHNLTGVYWQKTGAKYGKAGGQDPSLVTISFIVLQPINWNGFQLITDQRSNITFVDFGGLLAA